MRSPYTLRLLLVLGALLLACSAFAQTIVFYQSDFDFNGNLTIDSAWGTAELTFVGYAQEMFLNISVNGTWQVQDYPVLSIEGEGVTQTQSFVFDLGVPNGTDITSLVFGWTLTPMPTAVMPLSTTPAPVLQEMRATYPSGDATFFPVGPVAPGPLVANGPVAPVGRPAAKAKGFPNQQAGPYECAPTAVSNSLKYLKQKHNLAIADSNTSIAKMKTACGFIANWGCPRDSWWQNKKYFMHDHKIPIITKKVAGDEFYSIMEELKDGQDVEMELWGHTVAVTGIKDLGDGKFSIAIAHDKDQNDNTKGLETGWSTIDESTGQFTSGILKHYQGINYFVVECPEPTEDTVETKDTSPKGSSNVRTGPVSGLPTIAADYFGPGSDPFEGQVALRGTPLDDETMGGACVLLQRYGNPALVESPTGWDAEFEIQMTALNMENIDPVLISYFGGMMVEEWDLQVTLTPLVDPAYGTMTVHRTSPDGGFFEGTVPVRPRLTFTRISDGTEVVYDPYDLDPLEPPMELAIVPAPWVYTAEPSLNLVSPNDGYFVWGVEQMAPGDPLSQNPMPTVLDAMGGGLTLELWPAEWSGVGLPDLPSRTLLARAYPNPFNPSVTIEYRMPAAGPLSIRIYTLRGELVRVLREQQAPEGVDRVVWDGTDATGRSVASGVYLYELQGAGQTVGDKITLVK